MKHQPTHTGALPYAPICTFRCLSIVKWFKFNFNIEYSGILLFSSFVLFLLYFISVH